MKELTIEDNEAGQRLDKFLKKYLNEAPASFLYKMLRKKNITLNGKKASGREQLLKGDRVVLFLSDETIAKFREKPVFLKKAGMPKQKLCFIYEDADILAVNKPAGMLCQMDKSQKESLAELLPAQLLAEGKMTEEDIRAFRPAPVNRLDRNTSGIVLCGKSLRGLQFLSEMIHDRTVRKEYLTIVSGHFGQIGVYSEETVFFEKDPKENRVRLFKENRKGRGVMRTGFRPLAYGRNSTLVEVHLITGKTHQIRAHLAFLGYPVLGDPKYGDPKENARFQKMTGIHRQMLHAFRITFPKTEGYFSYLSGTCLTAEIPADMKRAEKVLDLSERNRFHEKKERTKRN